MSERSLSVALRDSRNRKSYRDDPARPGSALSAWFNALVGTPYSSRQIGVDHDLLPVDTKQDPRLDVSHDPRGTTAFGVTGGTWHLQSLRPGGGSPVSPTAAHARPRFPERIRAPAAAPLAPPARPG